MYDRSMSIGASDAVHIQHGQWAELFDRKQPGPDTEPPDYGLAAELGHLLEPFNLELFTRETGREALVDPEWQGDPMFMAEYPWCKYLPDGLLTQLDEDDITIFDGEACIPIESKCINMMWKPHYLLAKYMPQLQHAMRVMQSPYCIFSVLYLNTRYEWTKIEYDAAYDDALFEKEKLFYWFLEQGQRPPQKKGRKWI